MKTIKIHPKVHTELKTFVAKNPRWTMDVFASQSILKLLRESGHRFIFPKSETEAAKEKISTKIKKTVK